MRVTCVSLGDKPGESGWITVGQQYDVLSVMFTPNKPAKLRIMADNGETPFLADAALFVMSTQAIPGNWAMEVLRDGVIEIGPASWMKPGFWERYFDGDPTAVRSFRGEVENMRLSSMAGEVRCPKGALLACMFSLAYSWRALIASFWTYVSSFYAAFPWHARVM